VLVETGSGPPHELMLYTAADRDVRAGEIIRVRPVPGRVRVLGR
jgi:hypothetical protein